MRRTVIAIVMSVGLLALMATPALAYHDGGVAYCSGCHTMHNSENGRMIDSTAANGNPYLLIRSAPSDVCLSCHGTDARRGVWAADPLAPGNEHGAGNFVFLQAANINDGHNGHLSPIPGSYAGHNIISPAHNAVADPVLTVGPGGNYPASAMSCTSCHNPHGNAHFRLLYGAGHVEAGNFNFTNPAPDAHGITLSATAVESNTNHTAYNGGMSAWCANCHGNFHDGNGALLKHPSGVALGGTISQTYGLYNGTEQPNGNPATSYTPIVPFEDAGMTVNGTGAPTASSQVSCVTCHRAHATSGPNIGRWDFKITTFAEEGVESGSYAMPNPYAATAGAEQRSLCNKCHDKDAGQ